MTRISFIVPTFNRARYIGEALHAILPQMDARDELLVIDDGSTDGTEAAVRAAAPAARYVRQDNAGKSAALNRALGSTDGDSIWICDDDDVLRPGAVALLHDRLAASAAGFVFGKYTRFSEGPDGSRRDLGTGYWPDLTQGSLVRHILEDGFVMQNASLVRRAAYLRAGPFDETLPRSIDYDMAVRLALKVGVDYVDAIIFDQRKHDGVRGPAHSLHPAAESMKIWLEYDRRIFDRVAAETTLAFFEALFDAPDERLRRRAALLQRACVWGRHQRWPAALADLQDAAELLPGCPLHAVERAICRRILNGKHGFDALGTGDFAAPLRALGRTHVGQGIFGEMMRGCVWILRRGTAPQRRVTARLLFEILRATRGMALAPGRLRQTVNHATSLSERRLPAFG